MPELPSLFLPDKGGRYKRVPFSALSPDVREEAQNFRGAPKVFDQDRLGDRRLITSDFSDLEFEHGRFINVAQIDVESGKLVGTGIQQALNPAIVAIPVFTDESPRRFLMVYEKRHYINPSSRRFSQGVTTLQLTPPMGHIKMLHSQVTREEARGYNPSKPFRMEPVAIAGLREIAEESGYLGTGRYRFGLRTQRDPLGVSEIDYVFFEVTNRGRLNTLGAYQDDKENVLSIRKMANDQIQTEKKGWSEPHARVAASLVDDFIDELTYSNVFFDSQVGITEMEDLRRRYHLAV